MYILLPISLIGLLPAWFILRRFTRIWILRPISIKESVLSGISAWIFFFSTLLWLTGIILTFFDYLATHAVENIFILFFSIFLTGFVVNFFMKSRTDTGIDDTQDFIKEAIQFRRSAQRRLDIITLIQERQKEDGRSETKTGPEALQRARLQAELSKEKEFENQLAQLKEGTIVDISETWREHMKTHAPDTLHVRVRESKIDPKRKRLSMHMDFSELNEEKLKDETTVLRLNRKVYDFLQSLHAEPWLKHYSMYYESYYLLCRAPKNTEDGTEVFYPFMKVGVLISELLKHEGTYFNPGKLGDITTLAFKNGAQV